MQDLKINKEGENLYDVFGLTQERGSELSYEMDLIIHDLRKPRKDRTESIIISDTDVLVAFIVLAKTPEELSYLSFIAGRRTAMMKAESEY